MARDTTLVDLSETPLFSLLNRKGMRRIEMGLPEQADEKPEN